MSRLLALLASAPDETVRVLIVEDDRADAFFAQSVLTKAGMQAYVEHDPRHVLESLEALHPDLVLMDLHMPHANGVEVTTLIREHPVFARLPIVFLSGENDPDARSKPSTPAATISCPSRSGPKHLIAAVRDRMRRTAPGSQEGPGLGFLRATGSKSPHLPSSHLLSSCACCHRTRCQRTCCHP